MEFFGKTEYLDFDPSISSLPTTIITSQDVTKLRYYYAFIYFIIIYNLSKFGGGIPKNNDFIKL